MKRRPSLLKTIWRKIVSSTRTATPAPRVPTPPRPVVSSLEPLEGRISPASLVNPTTLTYRDFDGDTVTVKFTKSIFTTTPTGVAVANSVFKFNTGVIDGSNAVGQQLLLIDLTAAPSNAGKSLAFGTGITISAVKANGGNGIADVGYINATGLPLGAVSVSGDLGQIDAGSATVLTAITSLKAKTLGGRDPVDTQLVTGRSLVSNIVGALGSLTVAGDVNGASISVVNGFNASQEVTTIGKIGSITIAGSLKGRAATEAASDNTGLISAAADIGAVKIGTLATDGIVGGGGVNAGAVLAGGKIASLTVSGGITGSTGIGSGAVDADGTLGNVIVKGSLTGGTRAESGAIFGAGIGTVTIGGSVVGGGGLDAGVVVSSQAIGTVKIGGNIDGRPGTSVSSGGIRADGKIGGVTIVGSLFGGDQTGTGFVSSGADLGAVAVTAISGGAGANSGIISAGGKIVGVTVKGDITGGSGPGAGSIFSGTDPLLIGDLGAVKIGGKLIGSTGDYSGTVSSGGKLASITIGPATAPVTPLVLLDGGLGNYSGSITSLGPMGTVKITGHVEGGGGQFSGSIVSKDLITPTLEGAGTIGAVTISGHLQGGTVADSGVIRAEGKLTSATTGDLLGGDGARSGSIRAGQGLLSLGSGAITVKGAMTAGLGAQSGSIVVEGKLTSVLVTGALTGGTIRAGDDLGAVTVNGNVTGAQISAFGVARQGTTTDLAIGKLTFNGDVATTQILAGYDTSLAARNPDAQIGAVAVKGSWTASDLIAGVVDGGDGFGNLNDAKITAVDNPKIISQIASIVIKGTLTGTVGGVDHFGFVAQKIVAMKVGATTVAFATAGLQSFDLGTTPDVTAREVAV